jgi:hypothetical protein
MAPYLQIKGGPQDLLIAEAESVRGFINRSGNRCEGHKKEGAAAE